MAHMDLLAMLLVLLPSIFAQVALPVIDTKSASLPNQGEKEASLYSDSLSIVNLNSRNFGSKVLEDYPEKTAFMVNFYADWCAHCRGFVPTWENLALGTKAWSKLVKIGAINCASRENDNICLANRIVKYPSIKYFPRNSRLFDEAIPIETNFQLEHLQQKLIDSIIEDYAQNTYENWPNFNFLPGTYEISQLWSIIPRNDKYTHLALVFENYYDRYLGAKILLDFSGNEALKIRRVRFDNPLISEINVRTFPAFVLLKRNNNDVLYKAEYRQALLEEVDKILNSHGIATDQSITSLPVTTLPTPRTTPSPTELKPKYFISETDLLLASRYSLLDAVSSSSLEIKARKLQSLKNFVYLLAQFFPPLSRPVQNTLSRFGVIFPQRLERSERAKLLFRDLYSFLSSSENKTVKREDWIKEFERLEITHGKPFPTNTDYVHCRGSLARYRGYTCGLWTMFHALTVNAFYERGFLPYFDPLWILKSIQGYIENFFGCAECVNHFVDMVTRSFRMEDFANNAADVILYLWNAHNIVNHRLAGDPTEDPAMPKAQFPPSFLCPLCHNSVTGKWNETAVIHFLSTYYGSGLKAHVEKRRFNRSI